jgi:hypothetical protein
MSDERIKLLESQLERTQNELDEALSKLARVYHVNRWNIEEDEERGTLKICRGDHHSSEPCEFVTYEPVNTSWIYV